ncbi:hypothetical protein ACFV4K_17870 [Nocardia sp. NPDC059764]
MPATTRHPEYVEDSRFCRGVPDRRVSRIYGGSSEIMKAIISHDRGL